MDFSVLLSEFVFNPQFVAGRFKLQEMPGAAAPGGRPRSALQSAQGLPEGVRPATARAVPDVSQLVTVQRIRYRAKMS